MKKKYDVVIIGGGAQGLSLAYNLARKDLRSVAVLDKSYPGSGASGRNGEMVRSAFASEEWIRFFDASIAIWETLSQELDFNVMFNRRGYLVLASTPEELALCQSSRELQETFGLNTRLLDDNDVRKLIPALNPFPLKPSWRFLDLWHLLPFILFTRTWLFRLRKSPATQTALRTWRVIRWTLRTRALTQ